MSKGKKETSTEENSENSERDFVLDFLYHDSQRVGSFLSQFDPGFLKSVTRSEEARQSEVERAGRSFALGAPKVLGGGNESSEEASSGSSSSAQRVFDAYWMNARRLLNHLEERSMIQRDFEDAAIGQIVLIKGYLNIIDLVMFKEVWKIQSVQKKIKAGLMPSQPTSLMTSAQKAAQKEARENAEMFMDMVQIMPHSVHASMVTTSEMPQMVWCSLREEYLVTSASDLVLAHGKTLPGEWSILGIMNAHPEYLTPDMDNVVSDDGLTPGLMTSIVGQVSQMLSPMVRLALGRPAAASSITPLLIFREVR
jgi:hypothetical protein